MGRKKVKYKHIPVSISLPPYQVEFIASRPRFNLSKFVQIHLEDYINRVLELENLKLNIGGKNGKEKTTNRRRKTIDR